MKAELYLDKGAGGRGGGGGVTDMFCSSVARSILHHLQQVVQSLINKTPRLQ